MGVIEIDRVAVHDGLHKATDGFSIERGGGPFGITFSTDPPRELGRIGCGWKGLAHCADRAAAAARR
jgi:hypothetical protein